MQSRKRWIKPAWVAVLTGLFIAATTIVPLHAQTAQHVDIPVFLDRIELGTLDTAFTGDGELETIDAAALLGWLKPILAEGTFADVARRAGKSPRLAPAILAASGLGLEFDAAALEIRLAVPAQLRKRQALSLYGHDRPTDTEEATLGPAATSAYVNLRFGQDYLASKGDSVAGWQPTVIDLDGALSVFGATVESVGTYRSGTGGGWMRGDTRVVYDFVESRTRLVAGDVTYAVDGFGTFARAGGVSFGRSFGLQPYRSSSPTGQRNLLIDRRSRVDVLVNGQRVQSLDIAPGQYNVSDFPFVAGANDIMLRVTDDAGRVDVLNFPFVYDSAVLAKGEQDFQYMLGFSAAPTLRGRRYDTDAPLASAFHTVGVSNQITLGANVQASPDLTMAGLEGRFATRLGTFRGDLAGSRAFGTSGYAARLQYRYMDATAHNPTDRTVELSATYRSPSFASLGFEKAINPIAVDLGVRYGQRLIGPLLGSVGASWQKGRGGLANASYYDAGLSAPITRAVTGYLLFNHSRPAQGKHENRIFLALSWFPGGTGHSVTTTHDSRTQATRLQYHYTPTQYLRSVSTDASVERNRFATATRLDVSYADYRYDARLFQTSDFDRTGDATNRHRTSLAFGTAVAYAGGHFGVSRPITDSFALIAPHPSLAGQRIDVNSYGVRPEARTDELGSAVLPDLAGYYRYHAVIDAPMLAEGLDLGPGRYTLAPRYRSGTLIEVGTGANVILDGQLVDFANLPMDLELGAVVLPADDGRGPIDFFSDKQGAIHVPGLRPGRIVLRLTNYPESEVTLEIPEGTAGRYDAGVIKLPVAVLPATGPN